MSVLNYEDLDLRNHVIDNKLIDEILYRVPEFSLRSFKLDGINMIEPKKIL